MNKYLRMAMSFAAENEYDDTLEYHLCAVIVRGGAVISVGFNKKGTNGFVEYYGDLAKGERDWCLSTHAEMDAVYKARGKIDLRGCKIFVVRRRKLDHSYAMARPCEICRHVLYNYGIRRAYYTISENEFGQMKIVNPATAFNKSSRLNHDKVISLESSF
jgi:tRNA(Arg) A34 adenosine deaminase TadA